MITTRRVQQRQNLLCLSLAIVSNVSWTVWWSGNCCCQLLHSWTPSSSRCRLYWFSLFYNILCHLADNIAATAIWCTQGSITTIQELLVMTYSHWFSNETLLRKCALLNAYKSKLYSQRQFTPVYLKFQSQTLSWKSSYINNSPDDNNHSALMSSNNQKSISNFVVSQREIMLVRRGNFTRMRVP